MCFCGAGVCLWCWLVQTGGKRRLNLVVAGHVDAGKSTLMGRLLYELKAVDQRTYDACGINWPF